jgi:hypothetical protein
LDDGSLIVQYGPFKSQVTGLEFCPTLPTVFAATSFEGSVYIFELGTPEPRVIVAPSTTGSPPWSVSLCWSLDGRLLYCARRNETVDEIDPIAGIVLRTLRLPKDSGWVSCVAMLPDNRHLVWYDLICKKNTWVPFKNTNEAARMTIFDFGTSRARTMTLSRIRSRQSELRASLLSTTTTTLVQAPRARKMICPVPPLTVLWSPSRSLLRLFEGIMGDSFPRF